MLILYGQVTGPGQLAGLLLGCTWGGPAALPLAAPRSPAAMGNAARPETCRCSHRKYCSPVKERWCEAGMTARNKTLGGRRSKIPDGEKLPAAGEVLKAGIGAAGLQCPYSQWGLRMAVQELLTQFILKYSECIAKNNGKQNYPQEVPFLIISKTHSHRAPSF